MKPLLGLASIFVFVVSGMAETVDLRNFSIDTFSPNSNAVRVGEEHCRKYWAKHRAQYAANTRYLAVEAAAVFPAEIVDSLWLKLLNSETANDFFAQPSAICDLLSVILLFSGRDVRAAARIELKPALHAG